ncbi:uncharacterized protein LOC132699462 [Cylas formicarius]|uniref:uncharacterized protein LOC132699462 n=1 Tax=Cylas formicarius TaxID=197179 RepID=UPI0029586D8E|nr:uncharacterized protein LOC132699462 [Cylas formicarius]
MAIRRRYTTALLIILPAVVSTFKIEANINNFQCKSTNIQCLSSTTFTSCINGDSVISLVKSVIQCPEGYVCNDDVTGPCVLQSGSTESTTNGRTSASITTRVTTSDSGTANITDTTNVGTTTPITDTTFVGTTTRFTVERPTGSPSCKDASTYPAPACNQYYVCTKKSVLFISWYEPVLNTCVDGYEFSSTLLQCVLPALSDCP